jgi:uncharacterized protein
MSTSLETRFIDRIAREIDAQPRQVVAAAELLAEGATVPFVARYRKEATGGLEDRQLEILAKLREYFLELTERRDAILASIAEQGQLTPELEKAIRAAETKQALEDLYLPYKPKRRTRAQIARERGLEPLAEALLAGAADAGVDPQELAAAYLDEERGVADAEGALAGARDILAERLAENAEHRAHLRRTLHQDGQFKVRVVAGKEEEGKVYRDYFDHRDPVKDIPSHRLLAILRGEREGFLISDLEIDDDAQVARLADSWGLPLDSGGGCGEQIHAATADGYKRLLRPSITNEVRREIRERAEAEAIQVFRANLEALLLQAPLGRRPVMGLDPGYRTGCKLAVVDDTGRVVATDVIHPIPPKADEAKAKQVLLDNIRRWEIKAVAVGNGTGGRETEVFARQVVREAKLDDVVVAILPETGASVYSASAVAREELPDLDVTLRGAVSIARRLQDPLAELVKIEPKALGVGQYQHDVDQKALSNELELAVEGAVNRVGVEINTASAALLQRVSGLSDRLARSLVQHRDTQGAFRSRKALLDIAGFGPKTFELAAGFLRIRNGEHPLDRTAVHPERYPLVEAMAGKLQVSVGDLLGSTDLIGRLNLDSFADADAGVGSFTLKDIRAELERPGRDPRPDFEAPTWREDVRSLKDLEVGMVLEGRVSNVANFGAFVDIGVKRDGMVHLSELSQEWVEDPRQVVQVGQIVKVKVLEVDPQRERISLSMKALQMPTGGATKTAKTPPPGKKNAPKKGSRPAGRGPGRPPRRPAAPAKPATLEDLMNKFNRKSP